MTNPTQHEGILHVARQKIISNKALLVNANRSGLPQYIQSKPFMPKLWLPKGYTILKLGQKSASANKAEQPVVQESLNTDNNEMDIDSKNQAESDVEMEEASDASSAKTKKKKREVNILQPAHKTKRPKQAWYDEDHQWLGDKVSSLSKARIFLIASQSVSQMLQKQLSERPFKLVAAPWD